MKIKIINGSNTSSMEFTEEDAFNGMIEAIDNILEKGVGVIKHHSINPKNQTVIFTSKYLINSLIEITK